MFILMHALSFTLCNMVHLTNWVLHGLRERFPMSEAPNLKRLPSEYMQ